ncbi:MAG TPA: transposase [Pyrinomonadaceae bacterium]|nr:transposase [Pyrinomonadaceae bacterium]
MVDYNFKPRIGADEYGWYGRGYLPHFDGPERTQFLTFRLFDSMPAALLQRWQRESCSDIEFRKQVEKYLDAGYGSNWLRRSDVASLICNSLQFHHQTKYDLDSWVIMPNHVHVLLTPLAGFHLDQIEHSIKSYTAKEANKVLHRTGQFWAVECFDRYIRGRRHFNAVIRYIENNPVKARLCRRPEDWPFSSAALGWKK